MSSNPRNFWVTYTANRAMYKKTGSCLGEGERSTVGADGKGELSRRHLEDRGTPNREIIQEYFFG